MNTTAAFRVSSDYIDWAHGSASEDGHPLAVRICSLPDHGGISPYKLLDDALLVAEVADVAELYVGGGDTDLRAARVRARAKTWLQSRGLTVKSALAAVAH